MALTYRTTPAETATLTVFLIQDYTADRGKATTRIRLSANTLRALSNRVTLRHIFVDDWIEELEVLGWLGIRYADGFALIETQSIDGWGRVSSKRVRPLLKLVHAGDKSALAEVEQANERPAEEIDDE